jgi:hypothetical protein
MAAGYFTPTTHAVMIPESWRKEVILALYDKMVMKNIINSITVPAGMDTLHFPNIAKLTAEAITPGTALVGKVNTETKTDLVIDQNYGVPMTIAKQTLIQAQTNLSIWDIYKNRAAEALAYQIDQHLLGLYSGLSQSVACSGTATTWAVATAYALGDLVIPTTPNAFWYICVDAGTSHAATEPDWPLVLEEQIVDNGAIWKAVEPYTGNLTKDRILESIQYLDEANAPENDRHLVITPAQKNSLLKMENFYDASKYGSVSPIQRGMFGQIFGVNVWVTNAVVTATTRQNLMFHRDFAMLGIQEDVVVGDPQWMELKQAYDWVVTALYGYKEIRDDFGVVITTAA